MPAVKQVTVKSRSHLKRLESYLDRDRDKALDHGTQNLTRTGSARSCMREMDATREGGTATIGRARRIAPAGTWSTSAFLTNATSTAARARVKTVRMLDGRCALPRDEGSGAR